MYPGLPDWKGGCLLLRGCLLRFFLHGRSLHGLANQFSGGDGGALGNSRCRLRARSGVRPRLGPRRRLPWAWTAAAASAAAGAAATAVTAAPASSSPVLAGSLGALGPFQLEARRAWSSTLSRDAFALQWCACVVAPRAHWFTPRRSVSCLTSRTRLSGFTRSAGLPNGLHGLRVLKRRESLESCFFVHFLSECSFIYLLRS